jgi:hypothetical protein
MQIEDRLLKRLEERSEQGEFRERDVCEVLGMDRSSVRLRRSKVEVGPERWWKATEHPYAIWWTRAGLEEAGMLEGLEKRLKKSGHDREVKARVDPLGKLEEVKDKVRVPGPPERVGMCRVTKRLTNLRLILCDGIEGVVAVRDNSFFNVGMVVPVDREWDGRHRVVGVPRTLTKF